MAVDTLARGGIGFGLGCSLGQQAERFLGGAGQLLFDMAKVLFLVLLNDLQTCLHVLSPPLEFGIGEVGLGDFGRGGGGRRFNCGLGDNLLSQALSLLLQALTGLGSADLTRGLGAHGWRWGVQRRGLEGVGENPDARDRDKHL